MGAKIKKKLKRKQDESVDLKPVIEFTEAEIVEYFLPQSKSTEIAYNIHYQLDLNEEDHYKVQKFLAFKGIDEQYTPAILELIRETYVVKSGWHDFDKDLRAVSRGIPGVCLKVNCHGEDGPYELRSAFALSGKYYEENFEIEYPEFDYAKLKGVGEN